MISPVKCVLVGDCAVGKTSLLTVFATGVFPRLYEPTIEDNKIVGLTVDSRTVELDVWDTAGMEDFGALRQAIYPRTDCFLVCFSVDCRKSFGSVANWLQELRNRCPAASAVLVATKTDLRSDATILADLGSRGEAPVSRKEGEQLAAEMGLAKYTECSARQGLGVQEAFSQAVRAHFESKTAGDRKQKKGRCSVQ